MSRLFLLLFLPLLLLLCVVFGQRFEAAPYEIDRNGEAALVEQLKRSEGLGSWGGGATAGGSSFRQVRRLSLPPAQPSSARYTWRAFVPNELNEAFTQEELRNLGWNSTAGAFSKEQRRCLGKYTGPLQAPEYWCCIGSYSSGGSLKWAPDGCALGPAGGADYLYRYVPVAGEDAEEVAGGTARHRTANLGDAVGLLARAWGRPLGGGPNVTVSVVGDSVMAQLAGQALCPLNAAAFEVTLPVWVSTKKHPHPTDLACPGKGALHFCALSRQHVRPLGGEEEAPAQTVTFNMVRNYRPCFDEPGGCLEQMGAGSDVIFMNWGVHFLLKRKTDFVEQLTSVLRTLRASYRRSARAAALSGGHQMPQVLVWREAAAQHHLSDGGEFPPERSPGLGLSREDFRVMEKMCQPIRIFQTVPYMWRDVLIRQLAEGLGYSIVFLNKTSLHNPPPAPPPPPVPDTTANETAPILYWVPFYHMTEKLPQAHPGGSGPRCEATHYCSTQYVWEHALDGLYRAVYLHRLWFAPAAGPLLPPRPPPGLPPFAAY